MLCSKCGASLPEGSHFCPACGAPENATAGGSTAAIATLLACPKCAAVLPDGSQFCLKCGQPVRALAIANELTTLPPAPERVQPARPRSKPPVVLIALVLVLAGLIAWVAFSDNPTAQELREDVTGARTRTIIETPFSVKPDSYSYYDFAIPPGAVDVTVAGDFSAAGSQVKSKNKNKDTDDNIEVYVLTDTAFVAWRDGFSTGSYYESGRIASGTIGAKLPSGAGHYYLVFNNNFSPRAPKTVRATVLLHYRALLSESLGQLREKIGNWLGFN